MLCLGESEDEPMGRERLSEALGSLSLGSVYTASFIHTFGLSQSLTFVAKPWGLRAGDGDTFQDRHLSTDVLVCSALYPRTPTSPVTILPGSHFRPP